MDPSEQALERTAVVAVGVLVVLLGLWPWPLHPEMMLGAAQGEMGQHMAMLWKALAPDAAWMNWPEGFDVPVQDKVHLPLAWLGKWLVGYKGIFAATCVCNLAIGISGVYWSLRTCRRRGRGGEDFATLPAE